MIRSLKIQNLILMEKAEIAFGEGLNILTGETGAGKSAILAAIRLISGERADLQLIKQGQERAVVEAVFENQTVVRREISRSGKNRCFIDDEQVSVAELKEKIGAEIEQIDQNSSQILKEPAAQRTLIDRFAGIHLKPFAADFALLQEKLQKLQELIDKKPIRDREIRFLKADLEAIEELGYQTGEEEKLEEELKSLEQSKQLVEKLGDITSALEAADLKRIRSAMESCLRLSSQLQPQVDAFKSACLEIEEVSADLNSHLSRLETDPNRIQAIEQRLNAIATLQRRLGDFSKERLVEQLAFWEKLDEETAQAEIEVDHLKKKIEQDALEISKMRKTAASLFASRVLQEIQLLNLANARFEIEISEQPLGPSGIDAVCYRFSANLGHPLLPLQEAASGGEISRILFAIQILLSEKQSSRCLVFDEIDSNIGGQTATILGEKLRQIGTHRQVLCVTHFLQVAKQAAHHFRVRKDPRTSVSSVSELIEAERQGEYERMIGG